jgi:hypothetical protein
MFPPQARNDTNRIVVDDRIINGAPKDFVNRIMANLSQDIRTNGGNNVLDFFHIFQFIRMMGNISNVVDKAVSDKIESKIECGPDCPLFGVMTTVEADIRNMLMNNKNKSVVVKDLVNETLFAINNGISRIAQVAIFKDVVENKLPKMFPAPAPPAPAPPAPQQINSIKMIDDSINASNSGKIQIDSASQPAVPMQASMKTNDVVVKQITTNPQDNNQNSPVFGGSVFMNGRKIEISCRMTGGY